MELTEEHVGRLPLAVSGQYVVRDTKLPGFFVVVGKFARTFTAQVDTHEAGARRSHRKAFGRYGEIKAADARRQARDWIAGAQAGSRLPTKDRDSATLGQAWLIYRAELVSKGRQEGTIQFYEEVMQGPLRRYASSSLRKLAGQPDALARWHVEVTRASGPYRANGAARTLRAIYNASRRRDRTLPPDPPTVAIAWNREQRRDTGMSLAELPAWGAELAALSNPIRQEFHLLCLLSGSRPDALSKAQ
jgi:hypothetical protein